MLVLIINHCVVTIEEYLLCIQSDSSDLEGLSGELQMTSDGSHYASIEPRSEPPRHCSRTPTPPPFPRRPPSPQYATPILRPANQETSFTRPGSLVLSHPPAEHYTQREIRTPDQYSSTRPEPRTPDLYTSSRSPPWRYVFTFESKCVYDYSYE